MTKTQNHILNIVMQSAGHQTAEQVLSLAKHELPTTSLSTVYRNLDMFAQQGKIRRIERAAGPDYYERNLNPHDHAFCIKCGRVSDFTIPDLKNYLSANFAHPIISFDLLVNYICPECAKNTS